MTNTAFQILSFNEWDAFYKNESFVLLIEKESCVVLISKF